MSITLSQEKSTIVLPVQYLRGIAALMVVWHHARDQMPGLATIIKGNFGTSGVDLFFVISGFIMVITTSATTSPGAFAIKRIIRVVPMYWLLTVLMVAIWAIKPDLFKTLNVTSVSLVQSLLFIPHFSDAFPEQVWPLLVPGWTLNFEMFFYAVFAVSLVLPPKTRLVAFTAVFVLLVLSPYVNAPYQSAAARIYTSPLLLEFLAGAWIGRIWLKKVFSLSTLMSLGLFVLGVLMLISRDSPPLGVFTQILGASLVVLGALNVRFSKWNSKFLLALGNSSYSLYLTHLFTLGVFRVLWTKTMPAGMTTPLAALFMLTSLAVCVVIGWVTFKYLEAPLTRKLNSLIA